jgi:hypothetical protein
MTAKFFVLKIRNAVLKKRVISGCSREAGPDMCHLSLPGSGHLDRVSKYVSSSVLNAGFSKFS